MSQKPYTIIAWCFIFTIQAIALAVTSNYSEAAGPHRSVNIGKSKQIISEKELTSYMWTGKLPNEFAKDTSLVLDLLQQMKDKKNVATFVFFQRLEGLNTVADFPCVGRWVYKGNNLRITDRRPTFEMEPTEEMSTPINIQILNYDTKKKQLTIEILTLKTKGGMPVKMVLRQATAAELKKYGDNRK